MQTKELVTHKKVFIIYEVETDNDIDDETSRQPVAIRNWYGVAYDEEEAYEENPICFGDFGYYGDWIEL